MPVSQLLDDLAIKILVVEPGDLSAVGDLLEVAEKLLGNAGVKASPVLEKMVEAFKKVLEASIMGELADSPENFDRLGQSVSLMQEVARGGAGDVQAFCKIFKEIGYKIDSSDFGVAATDDQGEGASQADGTSGEVDTRFLADSELLTAFIEEAVEHLNSVESNILALEKTPGDSEIINAIFRSFHTVKGIASCTDLDQISKLAHSTENLLDEVRNNRLPLGQAATDVVLAVCDRLERMVDNVQDVFENGVDHYKRFRIDDLVSQVEHVMAGSEVAVAPAKCESLPEKVAAPAAPEPDRVKAKVDLGSGDLPDFMQDADLVAGFIAEAFEHLEAIEINVLELEQAPDDIDIINNIFRPFHTIKGVSGFLNLTTINKLAHSTENLLDDVRNNKLTMSADIIDVVLGVGDYLRSMVQNLSDMLEQGPSAYKDFDISDWIQKVVILQAGGDLDGAAPAPVPAAAPKQRVAAVTPKSSPVTQAAPEEDSTEDQDDHFEPAASALSQSATTGKAPQAKAKIGASIKVDVEKLDGLVNAVGELVIMQAMVRQNPLITSISEPKLNKDFGQLSRITTELQKTAMSMRMVPIRQTFQKMTRLVRDLSKKSGKLVDLIMEGEETEIDRNMVDSIYDPLVHMMRNSVDHGVQKPAEREAVGKPGKGTVKLLAYHKGGNIIIEIIDDGQGLNTAKIRSKAIERGLMGPADNISDHDVNNMIFLPGFSTADQITDVSGRGVGMDVVKKGVEKLRGKCELVSIPGEGTQFLMRLPLTLAIIDGIIVRVGQERYIIPTISVQESMRPKATHYKTVQGQGETIMVRNTLIPIIRLNHVFDVKNSCTEITSGIVVVVENEGRHRALLVDELLGKQEVVIKSLGDYLKDIKGLAGGTILGDGRVGLILDLAGLIVASEAKGPPPLKHSSGKQEAEAALEIAGEIAT